VVYKASHNFTKELRAVKKIEKKTINPKEQAKLLQEINILKSLVFWALG